MKLKTLFALPLIVVALAGCQQKEQAPEAVSAEQIVETMINDPTHLVKSDGSLMYYGTTTRLKYGDTLVAVKKYTYETGNMDKDGNEIIAEPEIKWEFSDNNWTKKGYVDSNKQADPTRYSFVPASRYSADTEYDTDITLTMTWEGVSKSVVWHVHEGHIDLTPMSIEDYRKGIAAGSIAKTTYVKLYGYITGAHAPEHEYSGVYMQDGDWAIQLYAGNLGTCYTSNGIEVGDLVYAVGNLSQYHGLDELYVATLQKVSATEEAALEYHPTAPNVLTIPAGGFNATALAHKDACLVKMDNLKFITVGSSATVTATNVYNTSDQYQYLWFKDSENNVVSMYIQYHLDQRTEMAALFATWTCGSTIVDFSGHLSWYDAPMLMPVKGVSCFTTHTS